MSDGMYEANFGELEMKRRVLFEWDAAMDEFFHRLDTGMNRYDWTKDQMMEVLKVYVPYEVVDAFDEWYTEVEDD